VSSPDRRSGRTAGVILTTDDVRAQNFVPTKCLVQGIASTTLRVALWLRHYASCRSQ
jgi:hypothetical protein